MRATPARLVSVAAASVLLLAAAGCGGDDDDDAATGSGDGNAGDGPTLEITGPEDGEDVAADGFEVTFSSSEKIDTPETGEHHVHLLYDGSESDLDMVMTDSFTVDKLEAGEHTLKAVLVHPDHTPTEASDEITVKVGDADGGSGDDGGTDDPYGY